MPEGFEKYIHVSPPEVGNITAGPITAYGDCSEVAVGDKVAVMRQDKDGNHVVVMGIVGRVEPTYIEFGIERRIGGAIELEQKVCIADSATSRSSLFNYLHTRIYKTERVFR